MCQLLEWPQNEVPLNIGDINSIRKQRRILYSSIIIKADDIQDTIKYEDRFENPGY